MDGPATVGDALQKAQDDELEGEGIGTSNDLHLATMKASIAKKVT